jgi:hypothetical protein
MSTLADIVLSSGCTGVATAASRAAARGMHRSASSTLNRRYYPPSRGRGLQWMHAYATIAKRRLPWLRPTNEKPPE